MNAPNSLNSLRVAALALCIVISGCASQRINDFSTFAQSGGTYVGAANKLLDEHAALAIDETSWQLAVQKRNGSGRIPAQQLSSTLSRSDAEVRERLRFVNDIRKHNALLQKYFAGLAALASDDHRTEISASAVSAVDELQKLDASLRRSSMLKDGAAVAAPLATIVVGQFQKKGLETELKARSDLIREELLMQEKLMSVLVAMEMSDAASVGRNGYHVLVGSPYETPATLDLSTEWVDDRRTILRREATTALMQQATRASADLREAFDALVENKGPVDFSYLAADLAVMLSLVESVKVATR